MVAQAAGIEMGRSATDQAGPIGRVLVGLSLSTLLSSLGISIANVALPAMADALAASFQAVQWVVVAYLLAITTTIVGVGRLGDLVGRRRLLLAGILEFTAASVLCAVAPDVRVLIVARAIQGLGAAAMMALTIAMVGEAVPKARAGSAMGLLGAMSATGTALGPSLGGLLIAGFGWRAVFLVLVPLGLAALGLAFRGLPADGQKGQPGPAGLDPLGTVLLGVALAAYALGMTLGRGHFGPLNVALLAAAAAGAVLFGVAEARSVAPLIRLSVLRDPRIGGGLATSGLVSTVMMATLVVGPFYLSRGLGLDAARVGLVVAVGPLVAALTSAPAGRAADRFGATRMTVLGLGGMAAGTAILSLLPASSGVAGYVFPLVLVTCTYALFQTANNTAVMSDVGPERRGVVSGVLNLSRNLGLITGASLMGAVFTHAARTTDITTASPSDVSAGMRVTFAVAAAMITVAIAIASGARASARRLELHTHNPLRGESQ